MNLDDAAACLGALGNPVRLKIYRLLVRRGGPGLNVGGIQSRLRIPASTLAHHLAALAGAGLIIQERAGREVMCRARYDVMRGLVAYLTEQCCAEARTAESAPRDEAA
jgi:DNA-binding transcriptional ArsR family regulator